MTWQPSERNFDNIQFESLRKQIDAKFNDIHDEISDCYYNKKPFRSYGILDKTTFDKLHGLIFLIRDIQFHQENLKQVTENRIPEEEYNFIDEAKTIRKTDLAAQTIQALKNEGIELVI